MTWHEKILYSNAGYKESLIFCKGLFIHNVICRGGSQKLTQNDRGVGGGLTKDDR